MIDSDTVQHISHPAPPAYFAKALVDAELLLKYAAETGVTIDPATRSSVLRARSALPNAWDEQVVADLLIALTALAAALRPVTAASLRAFHDTRPTVRNYFVWALVLAAVILPVSVITFVTSAISTAVHDDITRCNALAVKLRAELGPALPNGQIATLPNDVSLPDVITDLQEYAATVRLINGRARKLNWFVYPRQRLPQEDIGTPAARKLAFELPVDVPDPIAARDRITDTYQDVRYFAQSLMTDVAVLFGAITTCILPVLYALLGTCAYLIRNFEDQMGRRTFTPSAANSARFLIAAIGGAVVGLFNNLTIGQQASVPPLAMAFLVGYAVDVFFAFLEGILRSFTKTPIPQEAKP
ncbi:hypothetical protein [Granulicella arctica]|uniref:Uncharacterized protein n=1 Tax=Granulicella arctica TaxID=940613 RepID=A0A7Y9PF21_9BACT|nr:hypothetical protein [Granulicella arctica]NYF78694.1 hypothetical protein [Granulicella arctica]